MHDQDYDYDGNNIVPCPICLSAHCPSKEDGKCPEEDEFYLDLLIKKHHEDLSDDGKGIRDFFRSTRLSARTEVLKLVEKKVDDLINDGHFRIYAVDSFPDDRNGIYINREDLRASFHGAVTDIIKGMMNEK